MSQKMFAVQVAFRKGLFSFFFQYSLVIGLNGIPIFFVSFMEIVDGGKVQIFFMPTEDRFPCSNVAVRICNAFNEDRGCISEQRIKIS
jgi:hypothetical protein